MSKIIDRTGQRYGRWLVLGRGEEHTQRNGAKRVRWTCQCACGKIALVKAASLSNGKSQSCGCLSIQRTKDRNFKHGYTGLPEFTIWLGIKRRCFNPKFSAYPRYGGSGVTLAPEWMDFARFYKDLGPRPGRGYSIDRIDGARGYEPGNCRWATYAEQNRNTSRTVWVTYSGKRMALVDAAMEAGISRNTVSNRRRAGWPEELWFIPPGQLARRP